MALRLGDDTALRSGRLTLNPLPHIDPIGTLLMPSLLMLAGLPVFGYARPVPVDYRRLGNPRRDMMAVAAAGPGTNLALALVSAGLFHALKGHLAGVTTETASAFQLGVLLPLAQMAQASVVINVSLAIFNLLPLPPLDGGRVLTGLLPYAQARFVAAIEPFGFLILAALIMTGWLRFLVSDPISFVTRMLL
ncbi:MAG: site-2 protease family protein [Deltaproteobacteria bacterium]|nr:site-2 protease family protein [Deltaproteobacteria bacterium]